MQYLQVFHKAWFQNKRCLDIGCNAGLVSMGVATRFACASMLGVDIDKHLVRQSCKCVPGDLTVYLCLHLVRPESEPKE